MCLLVQRILRWDCNSNLRGPLPRPGLHMGRGLLLDFASIGQSEEWTNKSNTTKHQHVGSPRCVSKPTTWMSSATHTHVCMHTHTYTRTHTHTHTHAHIHTHYIPAIALSHTDASGNGISSHQSWTILPGHP